MGCSYKAFTPVDLSTFVGHNIIAPFWSDLTVNASLGHHMFYHVYADDDDDGNRTQIDHLLQNASDKVNFYNQKKDFRASCVYVATWENAGLYGSEVR